MSNKARLTFFVAGLLAALRRLRLRLRSRWRRAHRHHLDRPRRAGSHG